MPNFKRLDRVRIIRQEEGDNLIGKVGTVRKLLPRGDPDYPLWIRVLIGSHYHCIQAKDLERVHHG